jgi:hypothetical protein
MVNGSMTVHIWAVSYSSVNGGETSLGETAKELPSYEKGFGRLVNRPTAKKSADAQIAQLLRLLSESNCPMPTPLEVKQRVPTRMELTISPAQLGNSSFEHAILKVSLKDRAGLLIPGNESNLTVNYKLGNEAQGYCELGSGDDQLTLNVPYSDALGEKVAAWRSTKTYDERFPFLISVSATATPPGSAYDEITLVGPHTTGVHFRQSGVWAADPYDSQPGQSIGQNGCALTCMAMAAKAMGADTDPRRLNNWMKTLPGKEGFISKGGVNFYAILQLPGVTGVTGMETKGDSFDRKTIDKATPLANQSQFLDGKLNQGCIIIAQVKNRHRPDSSASPHWVLITGKTGSTYSILDPNSPGESKTDKKKLTTLADYSDTVYAVRYYKLKK